MNEDDQEAREFQDKCDEIANNLERTIANLQRAVNNLRAGDPYATISALEGAAEDVYLFQKEIENFD